MQAISAGLAPDLREIDSHGTDMANATRRKGCFAEMDGICVAEVLVVAVFSCHHLVILNQEAIGTVRTYLEARREPCRWPFVGHVPRTRHDFGGPLNI